MKETMSLFKSFLRGLLRDLKDLKRAMENDEKEKALELIDQLILDTQKGIED